jgi:dTMP kinase
VPNARSSGAERHERPLIGQAELPDATTAPLRPVAGRRQPTVRLFGSGDFFRLWVAQVVSAMGDWIGFLAIVTIAGRIGGGAPGVAVGVVMTARILPGFFVGPVAGVLTDRWDRKRLMVVCDVARGAVFLTLPLIDTLPQLVAASLVLEVLTLLWSPAKEASVPNLVPTGHLATANSLSLLAAYGTFPFASAAFAGLAQVAVILNRSVDLDLNQESVALYFNAVSFLLSGLLISTLALPRRAPARRGASRRVDFGATFDEIRAGWRFVVMNRRVRSVLIGVGTGLIGGGMLVPLGDIFTSQVLGGGAAGFGLVLAALGTGVGVGVLLVSVLQRHLPKSRVFSGAVMAAGVSLLLGASMSSLGAALAFVAILGVAAGFVYVLGFTILQENVDDSMRGRTFGALYTLVRLCLLIAFAVGPFLSGALGGLSSRFLGGEVTVGDVSIAVPGVRLTLWLAGLIILVAGVLSTTMTSRRRGFRIGGRAAG